MSSLFQMTLQCCLLRVRGHEGPDIDIGPGSKLTGLFQMGISSRWPCSWLLLDPLWPVGYRLFPLESSWPPGRRKPSWPLAACWDFSCHSVCSDLMWGNGTLQHFKESNGEHMWRQLTSQYWFPVRGMNTKDLYSIGRELIIHPSLPEPLIRSIGADWFYTWHSVPVELVPIVWTPPCTGVWLIFWWDEAINTECIAAASVEAVSKSIGCIIIGTHWSKWWWICWNEWTSRQRWLSAAKVINCFMQPQHMLLAILSFHRLWPQSLCCFLPLITCSKYCPAPTKAELMASLPAAGIGVSSPLIHLEEYHPQPS